jgi:hypothetical protein
MASSPTPDNLARALLHVCERLGDPLRSYVRPEAWFVSFRRDCTWPRALWMVLWALTAAYPERSPVGWAPTLGLAPQRALWMLGRCRAMAWWDWSIVTEAVCILAGDA